MTKREFWLVAFLGVLLIGAGAVMFGVKPFLDQMAEDTSTISNAKMRNNLLTLELNALREDSAKIDELRKEIQEFAALVPADRNEEDIVRPMQLFAEEYGVTLWRTEFLEAEIVADGEIIEWVGANGSLKPGLNRIPFLFTLEGSYSSLHQLSIEIQDLLRGVNMAEISAVIRGSTNTGNTEDIVYSMTVGGFIYSLMPENSNESSP